MKEFAALCLLMFGFALSAPAHNSRVDVHRQLRQRLLSKGITHGRFRLSLWGLSLSIQPESTQLKLGKKPLSTSFPQIKSIKRYSIQNCTPQPKTEQVEYSQQYTESAEARLTRTLSRGGSVKGDLSLGSLGLSASSQFRIELSSSRSVARSVVRSRTIRRTFRVPPGKKLIVTSTIMRGQKRWPFRGTATFKGTFNATGTLTRLRRGPIARLQNHPLSQALSASQRTFRVKGFVDRIAFVSVAVKYQEIPAPCPK